MFPTFGELSKPPVRIHQPTQLPDMMPDGRPWPEFRMWTLRSGVDIFIGGKKVETFAQFGHAPYFWKLPQRFCVVVEQKTLRDTVEQFFPNLDPQRAQSFLLEKMRRGLKGESIPVVVRLADEPQTNQRVQSR